MKKTKFASFTLRIPLLKNITDNNSIYLNCIYNPYCMIYFTSTFLYDQKTI